MNPPCVSIRSNRRWNHDSTSARYFSEVSRVEILDAATERELFKRYRETGDPLARDRIIKSALRFVIKLARKYSRDPETTKELISAGNVGLMRALDRYKLDRGTRFLSYATSWILLEMRNELYNSRLVAVPLWRQKAIHKVRKVNARSQAQNGTPAPTDEVCAEVDLSPDQLKKLYSKGSCAVISIHTPQSTRGKSDEESTCLDGILKSAGFKPDCQAMDNETRKLLDACISTLPTVTEQFIIKAYFGWMGDPYSLRQIGLVLFFTSERVRQIKEVALYRLKKQLKYCLHVRGTEDVCEEN